MKSSRNLWQGLLLLFRGSRKNIALHTRAFKALRRRLAALNQEIMDVCAAHSRRCAHRTPKNLQPVPSTLGRTARMRAAPS